MDKLTNTEAIYAQKLTMLLKALHRSKKIDLTEAKASQAVLDDMTGSPTSQRLKAIQSAILAEAAALHLMRSLN